MYLPAQLRSDVFISAFSHNGGQPSHLFSAGPDSRGDGSVSDRCAQSLLLHWGGLQMVQQARKWLVNWEEKGRKCCSFEGTSLCAQRMNESTFAEGSRPNLPVAVCLWSPVLSLDPRWSKG